MRQGWGCQRHPAVAGPQPAAARAVPDRSGPIVRPASAALRAGSRALGSIGVSPDAVRIVPAHRAKMKNAEDRGVGDGIAQQAATASRSRPRRSRAQHAATEPRAAGCDGVALVRLR